MISRIAGISYLQIFILILSSFAFAFILNFEVEIVIGQDDSLGCCFDEKEGLCQSNSPKELCEQNNGTWNSGSSCNILECRKGCCVLPVEDESWFVTEKRCEKLTSFYGVDFDYRQVSQKECLNLQKEQVKGACVIQAANDDGEIERGCKFVSESECLKLTGKNESFYSGKLCTSKELNTTCEKTTETSCIEGRDGIYFLDSCGNLANIYDSSKIENEEYWSNVIPLSESCGSGKNNANSKNCGNCDYFLGSRCGSGKADYGNFACKNLNCEFEGKNYLNGESWCANDNGCIGDGKDVVGSRYYRKLCDEGKILTEACEDFRQEVCAETEEEGKRASMCRVNMWSGCDEADEETCSANPDCNWRIMEILDDNVTEVCTPKYPPGSIFWQEFEEAESGDSSENENKEVKLGADTSINQDSTCSKAFFNCTVTFKCDICVKNCNCLTPGFTQQMNDWCVSLGDCGAYMNIAGEVTDEGYELSQLADAHPKFANNPIYEIPPELDEEYLGSLEECIDEEAEKVDFISVPGTAGSKFKYKAPGRESKKARVAYSLWQGYISGIAGCIGGPVGCIMGAAFGTVIGHKIMTFGKKKCKTKTYNVGFKCLQWQQPEGGECEKCQEKINEGIPCSEYRCKSLGAACKLINEGTGNELCIKEKDDGKNPVISLENLSPGYKFTDKTNTKTKILTEENECINGFSPVNMNIKTNEPAICEYGSGNKTSSIGNYYLYNHNFTINLPTIEAVYFDLALEEDYELTQNDINELFEILRQNKIFNIKCKDAYGNSASYDIETCVDPVDKKEPEILKSQPGKYGYFAFGQDTSDLKIWLNEPVECKYSLEDKNYESMENIMACSNKLSEVTNDGWLCGSVISKTNEMKYYVRCKDQPWFSDKPEKRNVMTESYVLSLGESASELKIDKIEPEKEIISGVEPASVILQVKTSGGAESGKSLCKYSFDNSNFYFFLDTGSSTHKQEFSSLLKGIYDVYVKCEDIAGNKAEGKGWFEVKIDDIAPKVIRVYEQNLDLKVITDENSKCVFSNKNCNFVWENSTEMIGNQKEHSYDYEIGRTYYIKCKDLWENKPDGCSIVVKAV